MAFSEYPNFKYNVSGLLDLCCGHLKSNLSPNNALDVLLSAHQANKEDLFRAASKFVHVNKGQLAKTSAWKEMKKINPTMIVNILSTVFDVWFINVGLNSGNTLILADLWSKTCSIKWYLMILQILSYVHSQGHRKYVSTICSFSRAKKAFHCYTRLRNEFQIFKDLWQFYFAHKELRYHNPYIISIFYLISSTNSMFYNFSNFHSN